MGNVATLLHPPRESASGHKNFVAASLINAALPAVGVGLEAESRGGTTHAAIGDVQHARRVSVAFADTR